MENRSAKMRMALGRGLRKGLSSFFWLLKILLPISLATALLNNSGWLQRLDFLLEPAMAVMSLPPAAALPILIGLTAGIYACLAAMAVLPFSADHMTLIAVFVLIAHNLPQEGLIQAKSGINFVKAVSIRLMAAVLTCLAVAWWLQPAPADAVTALSGGVQESLPFFAFLIKWGLDMIALCLKILAIIFSVMILIELMKAYEVIDVFVKLFEPFLKLMGLQRQAGFLWLTGVLFGLAYGGAIIVEQSRELQLTPEEVEKLQLSIGINHSMIEDPLLFMPLGVSPFWLWAPRLAAAVTAVYLIGFWFKFRGAGERRTAAGH
jgi:spore maturation protein SpmB